VQIARWAFATSELARSAHSASRFVVSILFAVRAEGRPPLSVFIADFGPPDPSPWSVALAAERNLLTEPTGGASLVLAPVGVDSPRAQLCQPGRAVVLKRRRKVRDEILGRDGKPLQSPSRKGRLQAISTWAKRRMLHSIKTTDYSSKTTTNEPHVRRIREPPHRSIPRCTTSVLTGSGDACSN